jgi:hypothetical protein
MAKLGDGGFTGSSEEIEELRAERAPEHEKNSDTSGGS